MTVIEELESRLVDAEGRVSELIARLERLGSMEAGLVETRRSLGGASENLAALASSTRSVASSLEGALAAFRDALEVLRRSDPARLLQAVESSTARQVESTSRAEAKLLGELIQSEVKHADAARQMEEKFLVQFTSIEQNLLTRLGDLGRTLEDGFNAHHVSRARALSPLKVLMATTLVVVLAVLAVILVPFLTNG